LVLSLEVPRIACEPVLTAFEPEFDPFEPEFDPFGPEFDPFEPEIDPFVAESEHLQLSENVSKNFSSGAKDIPTPCTAADLEKASIHIDDVSWKVSSGPNSRNHPKADRGRGSTTKGLEPVTSKQEMEIEIY